MSNTVISVENLSKSYRLGQIGTGTFANDLKIWWARTRGKPNPLLRIGEADHGNRDGEDVWALKDVSFTVGLGLGLGIIVSSLTTKYRDLRFLVTFGVQLLMYATPIIYPVSSIPERFQWIILANPVTPIVEVFRYAFLGAGTLDVGLLLYSFVFMLVVDFLGVVIFNHVEQTFMDTV